MLEKKMVTVEKVQLDKIVSLEVSGVFYQRINSMFQDSMMAKDSTDYVEALKRIVETKEDMPKDAEALHIETMMILLRDLEVLFHAAGYIDSEEVEIEFDPEYYKLKK